MKAAVFTGKPGVELTDVATPALSLGEALVRVEYVGICGSDIFISSGKNPRVHPPLIPGHEIVGTLVEIETDGTSTLTTNDRVAIFPLITCGKCHPCQQGFRHICRSLQILGAQTDGGYAEYVKIPQENVIPLSDQLAFKEAVLAEPLAVAVHAVRIAKVEIGDVAVVIGAGPIGLLTAQLAHLAGCSQVFITDLSERRLATAQALEFETIHAANLNPIDEVLQRTAGLGADVVFECVGHPSTMPQLVGLGKEHARLVIVGLFKTVAPIELFQVQRREQWLTGTWVYTFDDFVRSVKLLEHHKIRCDSMISHVFPFEQVTEAMQIVKDARDSMKVILRIP